MLKYAVLILWRKKGVPANFYAFCISAPIPTISTDKYKRHSRAICYIIMIVVIIMILMVIIIVITIVIVIITSMMMWMQRVSNKSSLNAGRKYPKVKILLKCWAQIPKGYPLPSLQYGSMFSH